MATGEQHAMSFSHVSHGLLTRFGSESFGAVAGQLWATAGLPLVVAMGDPRATTTWALGIVGLVIFHVSRAVVVWLERHDKFIALEKRINELQERHAIDVVALRAEREEHAKAREQFVEMLSRLMEAKPRRRKRREAQAPAETVVIAETVEQVVLPPGHEAPTRPEPKTAAPGSDNNF